MLLPPPRSAASNPPELHSLPAHLLPLLSLVTVPQLQRHCISSAASPAAPLYYSPLLHPQLSPHLKSLRQSIVAAPCSSSPLQLHLQLTTAAAAPSALLQLTISAAAPPAAPAAHHCRCCSICIPAAHHRCCSICTPTAHHCCFICTPAAHCCCSICIPAAHRCCFVCTPAAHHRCCSTCRSPPLLLHLQLTTVTAPSAAHHRCCSIRSSPPLLSLCIYLCCCCSPAAAPL